MINAPINGNEPSIYVGDYLEDKRSGKGRFYDPVKNEIYDGEWTNDKKNGEGTLINANGEVITSDFRNDIMEGR